MVVFGFVGLDLDLVACNSRARKRGSNRDVGKLGRGIREAGGQGTRESMEGKGKVLTKHQAM